MISVREYAILLTKIRLLTIKIRNTEKTELFSRSITEFDDFWLRDDQIDDIRIKNVPRNST